MSVPTFEPSEIPNHTHTTVTPPAQSQPEFRFTAEDLEKARREEKEKVYGRLDQVAQTVEALKAQNEALLAEQQARKDAEEAARREAEEQARLAEEAQLDARTLLQKREDEFNERLKATQTDWEQKFEQLSQQRAQEAALLEKERALAALSAYTASRVAEERDNIAPQLLDFIGGNTQEEIEASIERVKARSAEIAAEVQAQITAQRASQRGVSPTGLAAFGPLDGEGAQRQYSPQDIQNMSMQDYAKFRQQAGIAGGGAGVGMFG